MDELPPDAPRPVPDAPVPNAPAPEAPAPEAPAPEAPAPTPDAPTSEGDGASEEIAETVVEGADATGDALNDLADAFAKAFQKIGEGAGDSPDSAAEEAGEEAVRLINDLQDISFWRIGLIVAGTWLAIWLLRKALPYLADRGPSQLRLTLLGAVPIARLALLTLAILWVGQLVFNITLQNFLVVAGAVGVALGFAFKDYASSLIAGIVAVFERPYRPGDWIRMGDDYGEVISVGLRTVVIRTPADDVVAAPHSKIWTENVANSNDGARTLLCVADFYLAPDHDADRVREALSDVALTSAYLSFGKPVAVMLSETPWGTHYKVKAYPFDMRDQFAFVSDLTVRGKRAVADAGGTEIAAPAPGPTV
ncbi:mechanosensitive ion channel family protein [Alienimonas chondri]|uniref:Mechanosensitive ion channel MscS domain-containing protein n=1 Tax=Alienimonas chondri TaxID=2681879 RepID=A0ABX1VFB7_9PLAN|nr:mechanosensitive ion channel family protein [Alienimonas chondri]NNJ26493.1 hypothetical protein [Alienimonas chondri]